MGIRRVFRESITLPVVWAHLDFKDLFAKTSFEWLDSCSQQRLVITKIFPLLQIALPSPLPLKNYLKFLLMTSHRDSHTTTDVKPEMIPGL